MKHLILGFIAFLISNELLAYEARWTHYGTRPLAMGNAFVAVANDYNALFYNPAGIARLKDWRGEFINPTVEISENTVRFINDAGTLVSGSAGDVTSVLDILEKNVGKSQHFALQLTPHLVFPGWGFGVGIDLSNTLTFHRDISANIDFGPRVIAPLAVAKNFLDDRLSLGASIKFVAMSGVDREFSINDLEAFTGNKKNENSNKLSDYLQGGQGIGTDVGLLFTPIKAMEPTLGVSVTDLGGTPYKQLNFSGNKLGSPRSRQPALNTGISIKPLTAGKMYLLASADAHAVNQAFHYSKKWNLGIEWGYGSILKIQSGLHQGELSMGFELDVFLFSCRFATYTEQLGTIAGQDDSLRDRRYVLQLKFLI